MRLFQTSVCVVLLLSCAVAQNDNYIDSVVEEFKAATTTGNIIMDMHLLKSNLLKFMSGPVDIGPIPTEKLKNVCLDPKPIDTSIYGGEKNAFLEEVLEASYVANLNMSKKMQELYPECQNITNLSTDLENRTEEIVEEKRKPEKRQLESMLLDAQIRFIKDDFNDFMDRSLSSVDSMINTCFSGKITPSNLLLDLSQQVIRNCGEAIWPREAEELAKIREYLMKSLLRFRVEDGGPIPDPGQYLTEFYILFEELRRYKYIEDLEVFTMKFWSYETAVLTLSNELKFRDFIGKLRDIESCPSRPLIRKTNFNFPVVEKYLTKIMQQMLELAAMGQVCTTLSYIQWQSAGPMKEYFHTIDKVSSFTSQWFNDSLTSAWPSVHHGILKEQILKNFAKSGEKKTLDAVADQARQLLANTGMPNHAYSVLIVRTAEKNEYEDHFEHRSTCSIQKEEDFEYYTIISRVPVPINSMNEQGKAERNEKLERMVQFAQDLENTIRDKKFESPIFPKLVRFVKNETIGIEEDFYGWGIIRSCAPHFWSQCPKIEYWTSSSNSSDPVIITTVSYTNKGGPFRKCEEFLIYFFV